jgi:hypothetical protein
MVLAVFDVSKVSSGQVTLAKTITLVGTYVFGLHYDSAVDQVWIVATNLRSSLRPSTNTCPSFVHAHTHCSLIPQISARSLISLSRSWTFPREPPRK